MLKVKELRAEIAGLELQKAKLQADYDRLQQLCDKAPLGYQWLDENGCFLSVNKAWLDILGYRWDEVIGRSFADFLHPEWQDRFRENFPRFKAVGEIIGLEFMMRRKDGQSMLVAFDGKIGTNPDGRFQPTHCIFRDTTAHRAEEARREAERRLLRICHLAVDLRELIGNLIAFFKEMTDCQAVGIRLRQGEDYPYYESCGFRPYFIRAENFLCERTPEGGIFRDGAGKPVLECMCGNILRGRFDSSLPFFTDRGSFWTNSTTGLLARTTESDRQARTRNRCNGEGYESVALIPFRLREEVYGLLQLNDKAPGRFTPELIVQLEDLAAYVSLSFSKHMADTFRQESEERYRSLFENSPDAIFLTIPDGGVVSANPAARAMFGMSEEEIRKAGRNGLVAPDDPRHLAAIEERKLTGKVTKAELCFVKKNGERFLGEVDSVILPGEPPRSFIIIQDITKRKQTEEALRESDRLLREFLEQLPVGTALIDTQGQIRLGNEAFRQMVPQRIPSCDPERQHRWRMWDAEGRPVEPVNWPGARALQGEMVVPGMEVLFVEANGREVWHRVSAVPFRGTSGEIVGAITVVQDIDVVKRAEEALRESEERYRDTVEFAVDGILLGSADGKIIGANSQMQKWLGRPLEQLLGLHVSELFDPEELEAKPLRFDLLNLAQPLVNERNLRCSDGTSLPVEMHSKKMPNGTYQSIYRDISERRKYEEELKTLNDELERRVELRTHELQKTQSHLLHAEKLSAIGRLSASIAHEFNNPLQGIMTILKGFQKTLALEKQDKILLDLAFSECERIKYLVRSLQDFNRPSAGRKVFMDVHATIDSLMLLSKSDLRRRGIRTVLNYDKTLPQILAIPDQIKQVILNLLQNAADACNGSNGAITISTSHIGERIAVAIKDNGIGIAPDRFTQIFQPFYTTKPEVKGTGLGLSICHGIIENHQGEIRVESEPGKGSTFTVLLPIVGESSKI